MRTQKRVLKILQGTRKIFQYLYSLLMAEDFYYSITILDVSHKKLSECAQQELLHDIVRKSLKGYHKIIVL
jgi:hypothetical protein